MAAAIATIADKGLGAASFAQIARQANMSSTRLISYHFAGRDDLLEAVVSEVYRLASWVIEPYVTAEQTPAGQLRGIIRGHARFYTDHRKHVAAVLEVWSGHRRPDGSRRYGLDAHELELDLVSAIFRQGQALGEFREFDPRFMAITLRHALNGLGELVVSDPGLDIEAGTRELLAIFDGATRR